jgi:hypothetical protein
VYRKGFLGTHHIASIRAIAKGSGTAEVLVRDMVFLAGDGTGSVVDTTGDARTTVAVNAGSVVSKDGVLSGAVKLVVVTDTNGDGRVDFADIQRFMQAWRTKLVIYDFNHDGAMTFKDFAIILADSFFR